MFSRRARWGAPLNRLAIERAKRNGLLDLTESNPTRAGLPWPSEELADALARGARFPYEPDARGLFAARTVIGEMLGCDPGDLILTASTSEAYSFLFKLLCDPGDAIVTATPSYPLFEHLASLESVELRTFPLRFHRRWEIERDRIAECVTNRSRAIVAVNPNNPTGSFVTPDERDALASFGLPLIVDEVFLDYAVERTGSTLAGSETLTFTLGGLSKAAALPHFKLAWIRVTGDGKAAALDALETIADNFLSVSTPVQAAVGDLLPIGAQLRDAVSHRTRSNLELLRRGLARVEPAEVLPVEGGWSAVIRTPKTISDEELAMVALDRGVVVQPGFFFDFESDGYIVVSLLTREEVFSRGIELLVQAMGELW